MGSERGHQEQATRVVLHVGTPKTGTTYLQSVLWRNRALLRSRGVLVPGAGAESMFLGALDLMSMDWGGKPHPRARGRWGALVGEAKQWPGTVVISQELLAGATVDAARAAVSAFAPAEVEVVVTARDLLRQIPAEWQENVKHGRIKSFAQFWAHLQEVPPAHDLTRSFRQVQYLPEVLERWASAVPVDHIRLVTVPPSGTSRTLLWERFVSACGIDADGADLNVADGNRSLDTVTTSLLRRVNHVLISVPLRVDQRDTLLKGVLADRVLSPLTSPAASIQVPADVARDVRKTALDWRDSLAASGYKVIGDLDDLVPAAPPESSDEPGSDPDKVAASAELRIAGFALARMLHELGAVTDDLRAVSDDLASSHARGDALQAQIDEHRALPPGVRIRRTVVELAEQVGVIRGALRGYRRVKSVGRRLRHPLRRKPAPDRTT